MIKKLLNRLFNEKKIECSVDQEKVDCEHFDDDQDKAYVGVPAPILNPIDEWFASPYGCPSAVTGKQKDYMEQETEMKQQEQNSSVEPENIHQVMYEMATQSGATTVQLDPIGGSENFQGGSENIHQ